MRSPLASGVTGRRDRCAAGHAAAVFPFFLVVPRDGADMIVSLGWDCSSSPSKRTRKEKRMRRAKTPKRQAPVIFSTLIVVIGRKKKSGRAVAIHHPVSGLDPHPRRHGGGNDIRDGRGGLDGSNPKLGDEGRTALHDEREIHRDALTVADGDDDKVPARLHGENLALERALVCRIPREASRGPFSWSSTLLLLVRVLLKELFDDLFVLLDLDILRSASSFVGSRRAQLGVPGARVPAPVGLARERGSQILHLFVRVCQQLGVLSRPLSFLSASMTACASCETLLVGRLPLAA